MFGKPLVLFELIGFKVRVDASWLLLALLVTWSLAEGLFPAFHEGLSARTYWSMGIAGMAGLVASILFHELSHSVVARRFGLPIKGITLFIFGGVAEMEEEPASPGVELLMAIAGPIASFVLAVAFYLFAGAASVAGWPEAMLGVLRYLALINAMLAGFNLIPAFPLDGGRVFRALLWRWKGDFRWATRVAAGSGDVFGLLLIFLGVLQVFAGNFIGGMWWFLIGMFLRGAAAGAYRQLLTRRTFEGEPVRRFMTDAPVSVPPDISVHDLVEDYFYGYHHDLFPVAEDHRVIGYVTTREVKQVPRADWGQYQVRQIMETALSEVAIAPEADAVQALSRMRQSGASRLIVIDHGRLVGIIALKDLLEFLGLKMDLEPDA